MPSPNLSEIITTTLRNRSKKLADNVTKNNALLNRLSERGNVKPVSGGRTILQELEYAENATFQWYSGYETLNINPSDVFTSAEFDWKQASVAVSASGLEVEVQNTGSEAVIDLLTSRIKNAERTMENNIAQGTYATGTGSGGKEMGGLQLLVADDPTGTVGGINATTWTFWRNIAFSSSTDGGAAASAANIQNYMTQVWVQLVRNMDKPDLIVADNNYYTFYWNSLQAIQRINSVARGEAGYTEIGYMGADVVPDGGLSGDAPANRMYFFNTKYFQLVTHEKRQWVPLDARYSTNQDAMVQYVVWAGNLVCSNRSLQGVILP
jgi:hypothetical protein